MLLAFETSCDETSVAVVHDGSVLVHRRFLANQLHAEYGGVVPELAAREHLRNLIPVAQPLPCRSAGHARSNLMPSPPRTGRVCRMR